MSSLAKQFILAATLFCSTLFVSVYSCGDILIKATDGTLLNARSMEFGVPLDSTLGIHVRGDAFESRAPNKAKGLSWNSKYGFIGFMAVGLDFPTDGLNEKGLSFGALWLPTSTYQEILPSNSTQALLLNDLGSWILGNFATVEEVKAALPSVFVWGEVVEQIGIIPPLHFAVHDTSGKSIVIEFREGQQKVYDNPLAVLTNYPTFPWHVDNVRNYIKLSAENAPSIKYNGAILSFYGQGSGLLGMPGDYTPASRFVRLAYLKNIATPAKNASELLGLAQHLFNNVDIAIGFIRDGEKQDPTDYTQFVTFKDLTNKIIYYRTYGNMSLRAVDLKGLDFNEGKKYKALPIEMPLAVIDVTKDLTILPVVEPKAPVLPVTDHPAEMNDLGLPIEQAPQESINSNIK
jgi:choloylglycine hydrolase